MRNGPWCRGVRHIVAFAPASKGSDTQQATRCKPCERLFRRVKDKGLDLGWLETHLRDGSIRSTKKSRPVTTCMSPDADTPWPGDEVQAADLPQEAPSCGTPKRRRIRLTPEAAAEKVQNQGEQRHRVGDGLQGAVAVLPVVCMQRAASIFYCFDCSWRFFSAPACGS